MPLIPSPYASTQPVLATWRLSASDQRMLQVVLNRVTILSSRSPPCRSASNLIRTGRPKGASLPGRKDPRIDPDSLRATLDAHRAANETARIRKVQSDDRYRTEGSKRPQIHYSENDLSLRADGTKPSVKHLQLPRTARYATQRRPKGAVITRERSWNITSDLTPAEMYPWMEEMDNTALLSPDPNQRLDAEIRAFEAFMTPTAEEAQVFKSVYAQIVKQGGLGPKQASLMGSQSTGLAKMLSDIDINVGAASGMKPRQLGERGPSPGRPEARRAHLNSLEKIYTSLKTKPMTYKVKFIRRARVPIIDGTHLPTGINFDIQSASGGDGSLEYVRNYVNEFPTLRPLQFVIRHFLHMRGLATPATGGLGSYATIMMIVATLKFNSGRYHRTHTATPLLDFLDFYSDFNFHDDCISLEPPELFHKRPIGRVKVRDDALSDDPVYRCRNLINGRVESQPFLMCLQDPADPSNDPGKISYRIQDVQATLKDANAKLKDAMAEYDGLSPAVRPSKSLLDPLVGADYRLFQRCREGLLLGWTMYPITNPGLRVRPATGTSPS